MERHEFMQLPIEVIPQVIDEYNLEEIARDGKIYICIEKGMYGLPQVGILANKLLTERLAQKGYHPCPHTPGLWKHEWRPVTFSLVVDDFGIKYVGKKHAKHFLDTLKEHYEVSEDWSGTRYCGITLEWDYPRGKVYLSMPGYIAAALQKYQHPFPTTLQDAPHPHKKPQYGAKVQLTDPPNESPPLQKLEIRRIQGIIGTLLYYARQVDPTMLVAIGTIAAAQAHGTEETAKAVTHLLDYCATHPDAVICYKALDMVLKIHSDASYLSEKEARSRAGGYFFLGNKHDNQFNGPLHILSTILRNVMASAAEAELGALFENAKEAVAIHHALIEMGHPQPPTPIQVDKAVAHGIVNSNIRQRKSKAIDMRFYWVRDRVQQKQFIVYWEPGHNNKADYFTKHHPPEHHRQVRGDYLHVVNVMKLESALQGCVDFPCGNPESQKWNSVQSTSQQHNLLQAVTHLRQLLFAPGNATSKIGVNLPSTKIRS